MSEAHANNEKFLSATALAGASLPLVEGAAALMHGGVIGGIVALGVSGLVYALADEMAKNGRGVTLPASPVPSKGERQPGKKGFLYRAFTGKDFRDEDDEQGQERDTDTLPDDCVVLADDLIIPVNNIAGKALLISGMSRSGKTTLGVLIAEELARFDVPLLIPDFEGDYLSLADDLPRMVIAAHPDAAQQYADYTYEAVTHANAAQLGYGILEYGLQVVLDLASYPSLEEGWAAHIMLINGMFAWAKQFPEKRVPCHIYLDEAQRYLPENPKESVIDDPKVLALLFKAYKDILAIGGKRGIRPVILTQRLAQVNKKIMAQSEIIFVMRQTNDNDLERCMGYVNKEIATEKTIPSFKQGEGVYIDYEGKQSIHQFHNRRSDGALSATPTVERTKRYAEIPVSSFSLSQMTLPDPENHAQNTAGAFTRERGENSVKRPMKAGEAILESRALSQGKGEAFTVSSEDEQAVIQAYIYLKEHEKTVTRAAIKDYLGWNNKKHPVVKFVCDKFSIA